MIYNRPTAFPVAGSVRGVAGVNGVGGVTGGVRGVGGVLLPQSFRRLSPSRSRDSSFDR